LRAPGFRWRRNLPIARHGHPDLADLDQHRGYLLRVARLQLRDEALAEDVVQETLLAALSGSGFSGRSSLRTWLTGILKHKIVDAIRRKTSALASRRLTRNARSTTDALFNDRTPRDNLPADGNPRATRAPGLHEDDRILPREAAAQHGARVHDARGDGARIRGDL
jgi:DNA-directed RNA polymerase specialized sigma24 family protein